MCLICIVQHSEGEPHLSATVSAFGTIVRKTFPLTTYVESLYKISCWLDELRQESVDLPAFAYP